ncbi:Scr1 family TA system antitoxin-like transcriptional regulator [Actinophytocola sp.]|uniref:Scr1 family TA system antitoxin-like transcriptional regulator n=1 Tax=Actinophytocola sp. TaxID=1872138 RepID=UPI003D6B1296
MWCHGTGAPFSVGLGEGSEASERLLEYDDHPSGRRRALADLESAAASIVGVAPFAVPALLQTESYMRATRFFVDARVFNETGLHRDVMSDQVHHLLRMVDVNDSTPYAPTGMSCQSWQRGVEPGRHALVAENDRCRS